MSVIKIFGLPRSCTNVVEIALSTNFKVNVLTNYPDWKHGKAIHVHNELNCEAKNLYTNDLKYVICTKNPYDWLNSLNSFENKTKLSKPKEFLNFLKNTAWHYKKYEELGLSSGKPIEVFNELMIQWFTALDMSRTIQIKHEEFMNNQIEVLNSIREKFKLEPKQVEIQKIDKRVAPCAKVTDVQFKFNNKLETCKIPREVIDYINARLDAKAMSLSGYDYR